MSNKIIKGLSLIVVALGLLGLALVRDLKFNQHLQQQLQVVQEANNDYLNIINWELEQRLNNVSYIQGLTKGSYTIGDNLIIDDGTYIVINQSNQDLDININDNTFTLSAQKGNYPYQTTIYLKQDDVIKLNHNATLIKEVDNA